MINSIERNDILVFNCYLCHVRYFICFFFVGSTKIGEISDISKFFENFVSQTLGVLTRIYAAELRKYTIFTAVSFLFYLFYHSKFLKNLLFATQNLTKSCNLYFGISVHMLLNPRKVIGQL